MWNTCIRLVVLSTRYFRRKNIAEILVILLKKALRGSPPRPFIISPVRKARSIQIRSTIFLWEIFHHYNLSNREAFIPGSCRNVEIRSDIFYMTYIRSAVRQRTGRQETTMTRHGTMPELLYQKNLHISDKVDFIATEAPADSDVDSVQSNEELVEFDTSFNVDEVHEGASQEIDGIGNLRIDGAATFLVGGTTRFGRSARINSRILS